MVDFYGINVDKYTSHMDGMGDDSLDFFEIGTCFQIFIKSRFFLAIHVKVFFYVCKKG